MRRPRLLASLAAAAAVALGLPATPAAGATSLPDLRRSHGAAWQLTLDPETGRPRRLLGGAVPWAIQGASGPDRDAELLERAEDFLDEWSSLLALDASALRPSSPAVTHAGTIAVVAFDVAPGGVPVVGARVTLVVQREALVAVHAVGTQPVHAGTRPAVPGTQAVARALGAGDFDPAATDVLARRLVLVPRDDGHVLAWEIVLRDRARPRRSRALVDAATGTMIAMTDETVSACSPPPAGGALRRVRGGVRPERASEPEREELLAGVAIGATASGPDGFFLPPPPPVAGRLDGAEVSIECVGCASPPDPEATAGPDGEIDFGSGGVDETGNGASTASDRAAWFHALEARRFAARWLPLPFTSEHLPIRTNIPSACNAFWDGVALNFFRSTGACANTGEIRDVIQHEWGHGLDENDGLPPPSLSVDGATGEAVADIVAMLRSRDSCIGESFLADPAAGESDTCDGVRDMDEKAPGHRRGTLTTGNAGSRCPPHPFYRGPLGGEGHCEGEVFGQAAWHLVQNLRTGTSHADGTPLPDGPVSEDAAWEIVERLFFTSRPMLASYAPSSLQSIGMSAYDAFLLADDEGDGVGNGTPHAGAIHEAFAHHGLEESPVPPADTGDCAGPPPPAVAVTGATDPDSGTPALAVSWTDTGAAAYQVLRADDPDDAYLPVGPPAGAGAGSHVDRAVLPSRTYLYRVEAVDGAGCASLPAPPVAASPGAVLRVAAIRVDDAGSPAPDGRLETGETVDLFVDLQNGGSGSATNLSVSIASTDARLVVLDAGPVSYGTLGPGATVAGPAPFRVRADEGVALAVVLLASGEADEGCLRASGTLDVAAPVLALSGHAIDDTAGGDGNGRWDPGETIDLSPLLENLGTLVADPVAAALSFRGAPVAGVTIGVASATWPPLPPGGLPEPPGLPPFSLTADISMGPRTRVPLTLDVSVGGAPHRAFALDLTVGRFVPGTLEWTHDPGGGGKYTEDVTPVIIQLDDDDDDGAIGRCDTPDVVISESRPTGNVLVALDGRTGIPKWELADPCTTGEVFNGMAAGDIDGDGENEIVVADIGAHVCAIDPDGSVLWRSAAPAHAGQQFSGHVAPQVWDLDGDGEVEVIAGHTVLRGRDGSVLFDQDRSNYGRVVVGDFDLDGRAEWLAGRGGFYRADGSPHPWAFTNLDIFQPASVANLDGDPEAEIVLADPAGTLRAFHHDGTLLWSVLPPGPRGAQGPMAVADFDGDGAPEIAFSTIDTIRIVEADGTLGSWATPVRDISGSAGVSAFDFDGDGPPEILFRDHETLSVIDGATGEILWQVPAISGTAFEYPLVADVDADGAAEIVVLDGMVGGIVRVRCYGAPEWPAARSVWNQEDYSVTNVEEDGSIPRRVAPSWLVGNEHRVQAPACPCAGPTVDVTWEPADCGQPLVCFRAVVAGGVGPHDVRWDFGDGATETGLVPCHVFPSTGDWLVRVRVTDANGCEHDWAGYVEIPEPLAVTFTMPPSCVGVDACVTAVATGGEAPITFEWVWGDGTPSSAGASACHAFAAGSRWVVVFALDARGCDAVAFQRVETGVVPADVGDVLRVAHHGDPLAATITAELSWGDDPAAPRPGDETYEIRREIAPTGLVPVPGTAGYTATTYVDGTPARPPAQRVLVHYYLVHAVDECGLVSAY